MRRQSPRHSGNSFEFTVYSLQFTIMENIEYYLFMLAAIIVAFLIIKRVVSCLVRSIVLIVLAVVLGYIYYMYLR